jgi:hypothetical protein
LLTFDSLRALRQLIMYSAIVSNHKIPVSLPRVPLRDGHRRTELSFTLAG